LAFDMLLTSVGLQIELTHRTLEINGHNLEAAKEAVETLCREFWIRTGFCRHDGSARTRI
jgi:hypothetical protein